MLLDRHTYICNINVFICKWGKFFNIITPPRNFFFYTSHGSWASCICSFIFVNSLTSCSPLLARRYQSLLSIIVIMFFIICVIIFPPLSIFHWFIIIRFSFLCLLAGITDCNLFFHLLFRFLSGSYLVSTCNNTLLTVHQLMLYFFTLHLLNLTISGVESLFCTTNLLSC